MNRCPECKNSKEDKIGEMGDGMLVCYRCYHKWTPRKYTSSDLRVKTVTLDQKNSEKIRVLRDQVKSLERKVNFLMQHSDIKAEPGNMIEMYTASSMLDG